MTNKTSGHGQALEEIRQQGDVALEKISQSFEHATAQMVETTAELSNTALNTIKKYPLHTALAAGAVGLFVGMMVAGRK